MMTLDTEVTSLRRVPMFRDLDGARLKLLAFTSERVQFAAGERFFAQVDADPICWVGAPPVDQHVFDRNHARHTPERDLDEATLWALATGGAARLVCLGAHQRLHLSNTSSRKRSGCSTSRLRNATAAGILLSAIGCSSIFTCR